jgi:hypothetical protein
MGAQVRRWGWTELVAQQVGHRCRHQRQHHHTAAAASGVGHGRLTELVERRRRRGRIGRWATPLRRRGRRRRRRGRARGRRRRRRRGRGRRRRCHRGGGGGRRRRAVQGYDGGGDADAGGGDDAVALQHGAVGEHVGGRDGHGGGEGGGSRLHGGRWELDDGLHVDAACGDGHDGHGDVCLRGAAAGAAGAGQVVRQSLGLERGGVLGFECRAGGGARIQGGQVEVREGGGEGHGDARLDAHVVRGRRAGAGRRRRRRQRRRRRRAVADADAAGGRR